MTNWEDRQIWKKDRGEVEIKSITTLALQTTCSDRDCEAEALWLFEVGPVNGEPREIPLCTAHSDEDIAFGIYGRMRGES